MDNLLQFQKIEDYDEWFSGDLINCPVVSCAWSGKSLAAHGFAVHGLSAEEFKKAIGVKRRFGLVAKGTSEKMRANTLRRKPWEHPEMAKNIRGFENPKLRQKAMQIPRKDTAHGQQNTKKSLNSYVINTCYICKEKYYTTVRHKFSFLCNRTRCRSEYYHKHHINIKACCGTCNTEFQITNDQYYRSFRYEKPVYCSYSCKGKANTPFTKSEPNK